MSNPSPPDPFVRRDIWKLTSTADPWDPITEAYAKAVGAMQQRATTTDPTSWGWQAAMHGTYDPTPRRAKWNQCQHASWFFLPWHRMYIYRFEAIVRAEVIAQGGPADWALPYWNYNDPFPANTLPPPFVQQTLPDGSPNPLLLASPLRSSQADRGFQLDPRSIDLTPAMRFTNFSGVPAPGFGGPQSPAMQFDSAFGALELQPHNVVHGFVGGTSVQPCRQGLMNDPLCAAADPIFWIHHSNIDRLWIAWLAKKGGRANPTDRGWLTQTFTLYDTGGKPVTMTPADVLDNVGQLNYTYESLSTTTSRTPAAPPPPAHPPTHAHTGGPTELLAAAARPAELTGQPVTFAVPLDHHARAAVREAAATTSPQHVYLNIEGLEGDENPGTVYAVLLNEPDDQADDDPDEHLVGHLTFFGAKHGRQATDHDGPGELKHTYDITELVNTLQQRGDWDEDEVTVTLSPVLPLPPPGVAAPPAESHPPVKVGRVSIFRD